MPTSPSYIESVPVILKINVPSIKVQKAFRVMSTDSIWSIGRLVAEKVMQDIKDVFNFGLYLHGKDGKKGKFLDDRNSVGSYHLDGNCQIDFTIKCKIGTDPTDPKKQKKFVDDVRNGLLEQLKEKIAKQQKPPEFNFVYENSETPISIATMNNDSDMIIWLMDNGGYLDFRSGEKDQWKTPLHLAAIHNKPNALKTLIQFGAWVDAKDAVGLTPLYYAATSGNSECVLRLLLAKADTEIIDEHGRNVLHQAAMNNYDCIVALLIDFGANMDQVNVGGNTPLHVAASRSCKESTKWLLLRGADTTKLNKSGKRPYECAVQAACVEICDIMEKFTPENVVIPPPRYIPDSVTEYDGIVSNVLAGLSSSIGREYTPQLYYTKPPTSGRAKSMMQIRKSMMPQFNGPSEDSLNISSGSASTKVPPQPQIAPDSTNSLPLSKDESQPGSKGHLEGDEISLRSFESSAGKLSLSSPPIVVSLPPIELISPIVTPKPSGRNSSFKIEPARRKVEPINNLKSYLTEKIAKGEGAQFNNMLTDIEDFEAGFVKATDEVESLRSKNQELLQKLRDLGVSV